MTTYKTFKELIESFCALCGLPDAHRVLNGGAIMVDDVSFSLVYSGAVNPQLVFIYADFGAAPRGRETDIYRALLEANLYLYTGIGPVFTISSETGRVLLSHHYFMHGQANMANELQGVLADIAAKATEWRTHYFLPKMAHARPNRLRTAQ